ncbi:LacI family DNA-binding transcriptional regulator [Bradyrhizobium sp. U87765 SZCCT0131]|nr:MULTISPECIES: LacI family DNA-binding transcriptional regulator [unclassified Bradyrhizobium]MBR1219406.1 LacI family DNA-binding transcriptional regulator [Bradyrhizobium sp. U87765 SZCCT0131]MBR1262057.1 LacI family DNA-binding transcriptional regulator [Bradyrhizobium sp. U87765 SZCCT0134]MBR1306090.1 LacI family DNA-binding transcriptional regulator [Bradyrhizobium sp. U87765 SZCCT0110]MBR1317839.1 LacI family DNA-binding transcriptional regulator [Bradyrhizobium sp. U87765 SZCCT0109]MB
MNEFLRELRVETAKPTKRKRFPNASTAGVSLADVAAHAGVSTATVSRVLNGTATVAAEAMERVQRACRELNYVPNGAARALSSRRTRTIGAVVPSIENAGFAVAIGALQRWLDAEGYTLIVASSDYDPAAELREASLLMSRGIDGLLLVGGEHHPDLIPMLAQQDVPFIETWTLSDHHPCVGFDNVAAGRQLADYLLDLGHVDIGVIAGRMRHNDRASGRVAGVRQALEARGLRLPTEWMIERPYRILEGRLAMKALLAAPTRPTAVICGNDQLAFGAIIEARASGLSVPADISITGFNDLDFAAFLDPPLTTLSVPADRIGIISGEYLLGRVLDRPVLRVNEIETRLVVRASAAPPRKGNDNGNNKGKGSRRS